MRVAGLPLVMWLPLWVSYMLSRHAAAEADADCHRVWRQRKNDPTLVTINFNSNSTHRMTYGSIRFSFKGCYFAFLSIDGKNNICTLDSNGTCYHMYPEEPIISDDIIPGIDMLRSLLSISISGITLFNLPVYDNTFNTIFLVYKCVCKLHQIMKHRALIKPSTQLTDAVLSVKPAVKPTSEVSLATLIAVLIYCKYFHRKLLKWIRKRNHPFHRGSSKPSVSRGYGEDVEVIEILTETDEHSVHMTIPLILPPLIMCSAPKMNKASGRKALAVCFPGNQTTDNGNQPNELEVQNHEVQISGNGILTSEYKHLISELEVMSSEGQAMSRSFGPLVCPSHSREPKVLLKELEIHMVGPKITTNKPESFSSPTINTVPGPYRSIEEHCTATNLSSVQRKYVGLWRPNERCL